MRCATYVLLCACFTALPASALSRGQFQESRHPAVPLGTLTLRLIRLPVAWVAGWFSSSTPSSTPRPGAALARETGWTTLGFPLHDSGRGVMLEIRGRTEIGPVEIVFENGDLERVEHSAGRTYGRGLYSIAEFDDERRIVLVRFAARARSARASMRVLLLRDGLLSG